MQSNLPKELAVYKHAGGTSIFSFVFGRILKHEHVVHRDVTVTPGMVVQDMYGRVLRTVGPNVSVNVRYEGTIWLERLDGDKRQLAIPYAEPKLECLEGQKIVAVFGREKFVAFYNLATAQQTWLAALFPAAGCGIYASDYFRLQYKTVVPAIAALWTTSVISTLLGLLLLRWNWGVYGTNLWRGLFIAGVYWLVAMTVINFALATQRPKAAKQHLFRIFHFLGEHVQAGRLPIRWREVSAQADRAKPLVRARWPFLAGVLATAPIAVNMYTYLKLHRFPPAIVGEINWCCLIVAGALFMWALGATRKLRLLTPIFAIGLCWLIAQLEPLAMVPMLVKPVRWVQEGPHLWLILLPFLAVWTLAELVKMKKRDV